MNDAIPKNPVLALKFNRIQRYVLIAAIGLVTLLLLLTLALYAAIHSAKGTRYLLTLAERLVPALEYEQVSGTLGSGLHLKNLHITTKKIVIEIDQVTLKLGADSLLRSGVHLRDVHIGTLLVRKLDPPSDEPFTFTPINMPVSLQITRLQLAHFIYRVPTRADFEFNNATLRHATFQGHELKLDDATFSSTHFAVHHVSGVMAFWRDYPLQLFGGLSVNVLAKQQLPPFQIKASGSLGRLIVDTKANWSLPVQIHAVLQPTEQHVPLEGDIRWQTFTLPFAKQEKIILKNGKITVSGLVTEGLMLQLNSHIEGKHIPAGAYQAQAFTDYKQLKINQLSAAALGGNITADGHVHWLPRLGWALTGTTQMINVNTFVPQTAHAYMPQKITAQWQSTAQFNGARYAIDAALSKVSGDIQAQKIDIHLEKKSAPLQIHAAWQGLSYPLAQLAFIHSTQGSLELIPEPHNIQLVANLDITSAVRKTDLLKLPTGHYAFHSTIKPQSMQIKQLQYQGGAGQLDADVALHFPPNRLMWEADIRRVQLSEFFINRPLPVQSALGSAYVRGQRQGANHNIDIEQAALQVGVHVGHQPVLQVAYRGVGQVHIHSQPDSVLQITAQGQLASSRFNGPFELNISKQEHTWYVHKLRSMQAESGIQMTGMLSLKPNDTQFALQGDLVQFDPAIVTEKLRGALSGHVDVAGNISDSMIAVVAKNLDVQGQLNQQPVLVQGGVDWQLPRQGQWEQRLAALLPTADASETSLQHLLLRWGVNQADIKSNRASIQGQVQLADLTLFSDRLSGSFQANIAASQETQGQLKITAMGDKLRYSNQLTIGQVSLTGYLLPEKNLQGALDISAHQVQYGKQQFDALSLKGSGNLAQHQLQIAAAKKTNTLTTALMGGLTKQQHWIGRITEGRLAILGEQLNLSQPVPMDVDIAQRSVMIHAHCWRGDSALCFNRDLSVGAQRGDISLTIDRFNLANLNALIPEQFEFDGLLMGTGDVRWQKGSILRVNADLQTSDGHIGILPDSESTEHVRFAYDKLKLKINALDAQLQVRFDMATPQMGTGYIDAQIDPNASPKHIQGALVLDNVLLTIIRPFVPELRAVDGKASLAGGMAGPLFAPQFFGEFRLSDGLVQANNVPLNLTHINLASSIRGTQATYQGTFMSGDGVGEINGQADWKANPVIALKLTGKKLLAQQAPLLKAEINPTLDMSFMPRTREGSVHGQIEIPTMVVSPAPTGDDAIKQSPDAVVIDPMAVGVKQAAPKTPWKLNTNIAIILGDDVIFRGFGAHAKLEGDLVISQKQSEGFRGIGHIYTVKPESVRAFGQVMELKPQSGVAFSGKLSQPDLSIEAFKTIDGHELGVSIYGNPAKPTVVMVNDAGLNEQETINALLSGRIPNDSATIDDTSNQNQGFNNTLAAAGISLGLSGTSQLTGQIGRKLGFSDLTVDADSVDSDTHVNVTGYLTPDLFVRYGRSVFDSDNIVGKWTLRYQVNRKLYLEASSSIDKAIDAFYSWRF